MARFEDPPHLQRRATAVNLDIKKTRRLAHGFRSFEHFRLRILLAASGTRPTGEHDPTLTSGELP